jgi:hypothetical protein
MSGHSAASSVWGSRPPPWTHKPNAAESAPLLCVTGNRAGPSIWCSIYPLCWGGVKTSHPPAGRKRGRHPGAARISCGPRGGPHGTRPARLPCHVLRPTGCEHVGNQKRLEPPAGIISCNGPGEVRLRRIPCGFPERLQRGIGLGAQLRQDRAGRDRPLDRDRSFGRLGGRCRPSRADHEQDYQRCRSGPSEPCHCLVTGQGASKHTGRGIRPKLRPPTGSRPPSAPPHRRLFGPPPWPPGRPAAPWPFGLLPSPR